MKFCAARQGFGVRLQVALTLERNFSKGGISRHILQIRAEPGPGMRKLVGGWWFVPFYVGRLGDLGTATAARGVAATSSLRTTATTTLEGTAGVRVGTTTTASGTATVAGEEGCVGLGTALLDGDGVFTDRDRAGLESSLVAVKGLEVYKGAVLLKKLATAWSCGGKGNLPWVCLRRSMRARRASQWPLSRQEE